MALPIARLGDTTDHGGKIITGNPLALVGGIPIACVGDLHVCAIKEHGTTPIVSGSMKVLLYGRQVARLGDKTGCGATIITAKLDVLTN